MARFLTIAAVTMVSSFSLFLVLYQIGATLGMPYLDFTRFVHTQQQDGQVPFEPPHKWDTRAAGQQYLLGVGKADITGPVVELNLMGYANSSQIGTGLRQRLYSRAFIVGDPATPADRFVYMVLDTQSGDTAIRNGILEGVKALGSGYENYGQSNIAVTGTHNHNGPGAWLNYLLPTVTSLGFDKQSYQAIVDGGVLSIKRAHESLAAGTLSYGTVDVADANINRSPYAYNANPATERAKYTSDVDKSMSVLKFTRASDNKDIGILTWFPVHGTSMYGNNTIVAGDNKGVAADLFEKSVKGLSTVADGFVAGFSQSNVGDTTPNTLGAFCEDGTNVACTYEFSLCSGVAQNCHGRGPNFTIADRGATSAYTIGTKQYAAARSLYDTWASKTTPITGSTVKAFHTFQTMTGYTFTLANGTKATTCAAALGYGFAGGTSDWPGSFDFKQGNNGSDDGTSANPLWRVVSAALREPSPEQKKCQGVKPILLDVGEMDIPYAWAPNIADIQVLRVGQLFMIIAPGEATTMSGRRWKAALGDAAKSLTGSDTPLVVIGGPANTYTHYIATPEEYGIQRYEGASTLYGPWTLPAYINLTTYYLPYLSSSPPATPLSPGPSPPDNREKALSFISPVVWDTGSFGSIISDAPKTASPGQLISATFAGANPRNNLRLEGSYAYIQKQSSTGTWENYKDDSDWELVFNWVRTNGLTGTSSVTLEWHIPSNVAKGSYRFAYYGTSKTPVVGTLKEFNGVSGTITI